MCLKHGSNTLFTCKNDLRMHMVKIESYAVIFLYFCEFEKMKKIFDFGLYGLGQWVIKVDKYGLGQ